METQLSTLIRNHLRRNGLSRSDFVKKLGYANVAKGHRRLTAWLKGVASPSTDQKQRLATALAVPIETIGNAVDTDHRICLERRAARRAQDPHYYLIIRLMAAVYSEIKLPRGIDQKAALLLARAKAKNIKRYCCLNTPDSTNYWLDNQGQVYKIDQDRPPKMSVGGRSLRLIGT